MPFDIVPQPQSVAIDGASFEITGITISDPGRFPKAEKALREELNLQNISSESKEGKLYPVKFLLDPKLKREEYRLQTTPETATTPTRRRAPMNTPAAASSRLKKTAGTARYSAQAGKPSKNRITQEPRAGSPAALFLRRKKKSFQFTPYAKRKKYATM